LARKTASFGWTAVFAPEAADEPVPARAAADRFRDTLRV
jgi:hypothetical protein